MGSSGLQVMPELQKRAAHVDQWMRGKTWITAQALDTSVAARTGAPVGNFTYKPDEMDRWKGHPEDYLAYRCELETMLQSYHGVTMRGSEAQAGARVAFEKLMREGVAAKERLADILLPDFPPLCKRQTPGHAFLSALTKDNVDLITSHISYFDATGIVGVNGTHHSVDAIVCATGFDTSYTGRFPCLGRNGEDLRDHWKEFPRSYLSLATDGGFPNCFFALGPNSSLGAGNLLILIEQAVDYVGKCCVKLQREYVRTLEPSHEAVEGFVRYAEEYFKGELPRTIPELEILNVTGTVYSEECSSWYKGGKTRGRVVALWPGSSLHAVQVLEAPRYGISK
jgi:cation diffusion facilitator CzcD-associated flavoprotein CzcO